MEGDNKKKQISRRLIYNILLVYDKVKTVKPIDGASFRRNKSSKLAKTAIVTEIEHFWHSGHFQKEIVMIYESLRRLILISLADKEKLKAWKPIDAL